MLEVTKLSELERIILGTMSTTIKNSNTSIVLNNQLGEFSESGINKSTIWNKITLYKVAKYAVAIGNPALKTLEKLKPLISFLKRLVEIISPNNPSQNLRHTTRPRRTLGGKRY